MEKMKNPENFEGVREITSANELTTEELQKIKERIEQVGYEHVHHLLMFMSDSLKIVINVPEDPYIEDEDIRRERMLTERAMVMQSVIDRMKKELGEPKLEK